MIRYYWTASRTLSPEQAIAAVAAIVPPAALPLSETAARYGVTARVTEVLCLLAAGHPDRQIAAERFVSVRTVEHHVARIFDKLGVHTRTAAVTTAIAAGLIDPGSLPPA